MIEKPRKIVAFHLYNDFSGSPKVLEMSLEALVADGYDVTLFTSEGGVLDSLTRHESVHKHTIRYRFSSNPIVTVWRLLKSQTVSFFKALKHCGSGTVTYINTILPFGAAIGAKMSGSRVVYHYHENAFAKGRMYRLLAALMTRIADHVICVSDFQASHITFPHERLHVIPNALSASMASLLNPDASAAFDRKRILMVSSLKSYKGTYEFICLASGLPDCHWELIINATDDEIAQFLKQNQVDVSAIPQLKIFSRQTDVSPFYNNASLVLSLTNPDLAIETFGLTAVEAMTAGLPVIVPTVGGIADIVVDGYNGYKLDVRNLSAIGDKIREIFADRELYMRLSAGALEKSREFHPQVFSTAICNLFNAISSQQ